jgi:hypothetical protein
VIERLQADRSELSEGMGAAYCQMAKLEKIAAVSPETVKIDSDQKLVVISIPEETILGVVAAIQEYYFDLLDIVPVVIRVLSGCSKRQLIAI